MTKQNQPESCVKIDGVHTVGMGVAALSAGFSSLELIFMRLCEEPAAAILVTKFCWRIKSLLRRAEPEEGGGP